MRQVLRTFLTVLRLALGALLAVLGVLMSIPFVPGPGLLVLAAGLTLLGLGPQTRALLRRLWHRLRSGPTLDRAL